MPPRRALLSAAGAALAALAGCGGGGGGGSSDDTPTRSPTDSPTATVAPAYDIELRSEFEPATYTFVHREDAKATIHVEVEKVLDPDTLESEVIFERGVETDSHVSHSWEDAFAPDPDAHEFVLSARYEPESEGVPVRSSMSDTFRFAAGSYSTPDTATFTVRVVTEHPSQDLTQPRVTIEP